MFHIAKSNNLINQTNYLVLSW